MSQPVTARDEFPDCDLGLIRVRRCRHGLMLYLASDNTIGRALELYGEFAESENRVMAALVEPGDTAVDVGANVGTVTLALARRVGPAGFVHAFEPQRLIFQNLCAALALNGTGNVNAVRAAVGVQSGRINVAELDPAKPANFGAVRVDAESPGSTVPLVTVDSLRLSSCALLKIDVEGMDYEVLLGATETVGRTRPCIYTEAKEGPKTRLAIAWLLEREYMCYWHFAAFYSRNNYRNSAENVFGNRGDINLVGLPKERDVRLRLPRIETPEASWRRDYERFRSDAQDT